MATGETDGAPRILVVEDDLLIAMDLVDELEEAGLQVAGPARTVRDALRMMAAQHVDAALLDVHLHDEDSYPIAAALQERNVPFAFLSGNAAADLRADFRCQVLLQKPVSPALLTSVLEKLLRGEAAG